MKVSKAREIISGLSAASRSRLTGYCKSLAHDRLRRGFDDNMYEELAKYVKDEKRLSNVKGYLDSIGFAQSIYHYSQIQAQLARFSEPDAPNFSWNRYFKQAKEGMIQEFRSFNLRSLGWDSKEEVLNLIPRLDTHAGFQFILTGKRKKGEYVDEVFAMYQDALEKALIEGSFNLPILVGSRTQASGAFDESGSYTHTFKDKSRMVNILALIQTMAESPFAKPLQHKMSELDWYAGGKDDIQIHSVIRRHADFMRQWTTIDYSSYDQSISSWLIHAAFDIIREAFKNDRRFNDRLFDIIRNDFIHKVIIDGEGNLVESHKGVPSGSMFTQIIDSIVNRLMITTYMLSQGHQSYDYKMMIMGDDNIIHTRFPLDVNHLAAYLTHNFGITVNAKKCSCGSTDEDPEFLSRTWTNAGIWREPNVLISKLLFPERFRNYKKYGYTPYQIIQSYKDSFPLGMRAILDWDKFERDEKKRTQEYGEGDYLTGLARYRKLYLEKKVC